METRKEHFERVNKKVAKEINKLLLYELVWINTAEGFDYWDEVSRKLKRIEKEGF